MDKLEFIKILESSLIKFDMNLSHIHGSVYFSTKFGILRIADHPKPYGYEMGSMKDFRSYSEAYDFLLKKGAINLNEKEDKEKKIKEYESLCKEEFLNGEICYKSPSGRFFVTKNDAASSFWHEKKNNTRRK